MPEQLAKQPKLPKEFVCIWSWFVSIRSGCGGEWSWETLRAWASLHKIDLTTLEIELLSRLNSLLLGTKDGK